jgi:hypothetical protein
VYSSSLVKMLGVNHRFLLPRVFESLLRLPTAGDLDPIVELHSAPSTSEGVKLSSPTISSFRTNRNRSNIAIKYCICVNTNYIFFNAMLS